MRIIGNVLLGRQVGGDTGGRQIGIDAERIFFVGIGNEVSQTNPHDEHSADEETKQRRIPGC